MNKRWIALICLGMFAGAGWALCVTRPDNSHAVDMNDCSHDVIQSACSKCDRVVEDPNTVTWTDPADPNLVGEEFLIDSADLSFSLWEPTIYVCPKHGESESCLSIHIGEDRTDYCALCLKEVIEKAGVHRVVLKKTDE